MRTFASILTALVLAILAPGTVFAQEGDAIRFLLEDPARLASKVYLAGQFQEEWGSQVVVAFEKAGFTMGDLAGGLVVLDRVVLRSEESMQRKWQGRDRGGMVETGRRFILWDGSLALPVVRSGWDAGTQLANIGGLMGNGHAVHMANAFVEVVLDGDSMPELAQHRLRNNLRDGTAFTATAKVREIMVEAKPGDYAMDFPPYVRVRVELKLEEIDGISVWPLDLQ